MLDLTQDIRSLTEFKRNTSELVENLKRTKHPLVLTVNGKAELVVQDAESYQALLGAMRKSELSQKRRSPIRMKVRYKFA
jgi:prevent-host-death family protein